MRRATGAAVERYDVDRDRWSRMPSMPTRRAALVVGVIGDRLYAAGGAATGGTTFERLEAFDFRTRRWTPRRPLTRQPASLLSTRKAPRS